MFMIDPYKQSIRNNHKPKTKYNFRAAAILLRHIPQKRYPEKGLEHSSRILIITQIFSGDNVVPISQFRKDAMLVLLIVGNYKLERLDNL
jgi:hypothetical protein